MAYVCKICHLPVWVGYWAGVIEINIEGNDNKLSNVEKCPQCGNQLLTLNDLEFIKQEEKNDGETT